MFERSPEERSLGPLPECVNALGVLVIVPLCSFITKKFTDKTDLLKAKLDTGLKVRK